MAEGRSKKLWHFGEKVNITSSIKITISWRILLPDYCSHHLYKHKHNNRNACTCNISKSRHPQHCVHCKLDYHYTVQIIILITKKTCRKSNTLPLQQCDNITGIPFITVLWRMTLRLLISISSMSAQKSYTMQQYIVNVQNNKLHLQGLCRKLCVVLQTFPGKKLLIFQTFQGDFLTP